MLSPRPHGPHHGQVLQVSRGGSNGDARLAGTDLQNLRLNSVSGNTAIYVHFGCQIYNASARARRLLSYACVWYAGVIERGGSVGTTMLCLPPLFTVEAAEQNFLIEAASIGICPRRGRSYRLMPWAQRYCVTEGVMPYEAAWTVYEL